MGNYQAGTDTKVLLRQDISSLSVIVGLITYIAIVLRS